MMPSSMGFAHARKKRRVRLPMAAVGWPSMDPSRSIPSYGLVAAAGSTPRLARVSATTIPVAAPLPSPLPSPLAAFWSVEPSVESSCEEAGLSISGNSAKSQPSSFIDATMAGSMAATAAAAAA